MAYVIPHETTTIVTRTYSHSGPSYQAYLILRVGFAALPIIVGIDKFTDLLTDWDKYLSGTFAGISPLNVHSTMMGIGVIEVLAGLFVALRPRIGAYIVAAWLVGIIVNLLLLPGYFDVALRDFGLCLGAIALGRLSQEYDGVAGIEETIV